MYQITVMFGEGTAVETSTNDVNVACATLVECLREDFPCICMNPDTGEILCHYNIPEEDDYASPEMGLMLRGWVEIHL